MIKEIIFNCEKAEDIEKAFEGIDHKAHWIVPQKKVCLEYNHQDTDKIIERLSLIIKDNDYVVYTHRSKTFRIAKENGEIFIDELQEYLLPKNKERLKKDLQLLIKQIEERSF
jgi:hypothetical protein